MSDNKTISLRGIKKELSIMAANDGILLKPYIEGILMDHVNGGVDDDLIVGVSFLGEEDLDKTGRFVRVEKSIYSNKKCYEVREMISGGDIKKSYFSKLSFARDYLGGIE